MASEAKVIITAEDKASSVVRGVNKEFNNLADDFKKTGLLLAGFATAGIAAIKGLATSAGELEQLRIGFTTMLGSADLANKKIQELQEFAAKTPFTLPGVEAGAKQLLAMGFESSQLIPVLKSVGDVAAGLGLKQDGLDRLVLNLGQVQTQGKLTGRELRDFAVNGVPLIDELAKSLGVAKNEISDMVSNGLISSEMVLTAFNNMTGEGGKFNDMMAKQNKSLLGQFSNLKDNITLLGRTLGEPLIEPLKILNSVLIKITAAISDFAKNHPTIVKYVGTFLLFATAIAAILAPIALLVGYLPVIIGLFASVGAVIIAVGTFMVSTAGLIIAAILAIVAVTYLIVSNWETIKTTAIAIWTAIKDFFVGIISAIVNWIVSSFNSVSTFITNVFTAISDFFSMIWEGIKTVVLTIVMILIGGIMAVFEIFGIDIIAVLQSIGDFFTMIWESIKTNTGLAIDALVTWVLSGLTKIKTFWESVWNGIKAFFSTVWEWIKGTANTGLEFILGIVGKFTEPIGKAFGAMWAGVTGVIGGAIEGIKNIVKGVLNWILEKINWVIDKLNWLSAKAAGVVPGIDAADVEIPKIPLLANGGIISKPTLAMLGEGGESEAVVPLSKAKSMGFGGGAGMTFNFYGPVSSKEVAMEMMDYAVQTLKLSTKVV